MTYDLLFAGVGGTVLGTLIGAWLTARLNHGFQERLLQKQLAFQQSLLEQQLDFQKQQAEMSAAQRKQIHDEFVTAFTEFRNMLNSRAGQLVGRISEKV